MFEVLVKKRKRYEKEGKKSEPIDEIYLLRRNNKKLCLGKQCTVGERLEAYKRDFEELLTRIVPPKNEQALGYVKQVKETSLSDWAVQFKNVIAPIIRFDGEKGLQQISSRILYRSQMMPSEMWLRSEEKNYANDEAKQVDALANYNLFLGYLVFFAQEAEKL